MWKIYDTNIWRYDLENRLGYARIGETFRSKIVHLNWIEQFKLVLYITRKYYSKFAWQDYFYLFQLKRFRFKTSDTNPALRWHLRSLYTSPQWPFIKKYLAPTKTPVKITTTVNFWSPPRQDRKYKKKMISLTFGLDRNSKNLFW